MTLLRSIASAIFVVLCASPSILAQAAPCTWLTQEQVSSALGAKVGTGSPINTNGCSWTAPKTTLNLSTASQALFDGAKRGSKTAAPGLGDDAFFTGTDGFVTLWMKKGSTFVFLRIYGLPQSEAQPKLTTLAKTVVSKL